jgi:hypothetical protein
MEIKLTETLKSRAERMAARDGDGDISAWLSRLINKEWTAMHSNDFDFAVRLKYGSFGIVDVAPRASRRPRWEVYEIFENGVRSPQLRASIDIDKWAQRPPLTGPLAPIINDVFRHLEQRYGAAALGTRPPARA